MENVRALTFTDKRKLEAELEETRNRLAMLTRPELSTAGLMPEEQQNIQRAVTAHRERIDRLERELKTGK